MEILGYLAAGLIGISLGLVGSGGSILTIPVLVYLFHVQPTLATGYSLFIVGTTALVGGVRSGFKHLIDFRTTPFFAPPSLMTVYLNPALSDGGFLIIPALVLFAGLPLEKDVSTSLLIIATNSLIGFLGDVGAG